MNEIKDALEGVKTQAADAAKSFKQMQIILLIAILLTAIAILLVSIKMSKG
ncbi:MAG TPA: hypothetical protein VEB40_01005 [Flavipsychrobacter sp.]|nr:hypothetical protein [Flavipsychrobacter sp.]